MPKPPTWDDVERLQDLLAHLREQAENLLLAARLPVRPDIHIEGLTGGLRSIVKQINDAKIPRD